MTYSVHSSTLSPQLGGPAGERGESANEQTEVKSGAPPNSLKNPGSPTEFTGLIGPVVVGTYYVVVVRLPSFYQAKKGGLLLHSTTSDLRALIVTNYLTTSYQSAHICP